MKTITEMDKAKCCGCGACSNICPAAAIKMEKRNGFYYPVIDDGKCISCGRCAAVCSCTGKRSPAGGKLPKEAFLYTAPDPEILRESSSGGFFTRLAADMIRKGGVVFSPAFDEHWELGFVGIDSLDMLPRVRGSKYVEADPGNIFREVEGALEKGKRVLFSGTPCQVRGVRAYLEAKGAGYEGRLILAAIVCHGNVSSDYFKRFLTHIGEGRTVSAINFREKAYGYGSSTLAVKFTDGSTYRESYDNGYYLPAFFEGYSIRENCFACRFREGKAAADFIIGDYWKDARNNPGRTLVFACSSYAAIYMDQLRAACPGLLQVVSAQDAVLWNGNGERSRSCLTASPAPNGKRAAFLEDMPDLDLNRIRKKYFPVTVKKRIKAVLRPVRYGIERRLKRDGTR